MTDHVFSGRFSPLTVGGVPGILCDDEDKTFALDVPSNPDRSAHVSNSNLCYPTSDPRRHRDLELPLIRNRKSSVTRLSRHGIPCPRIPVSVVNKLTTSLARSVTAQSTKIKKDTLSAILEASDWFFEQVGTDLGTYAKHGRRKIVDETEVVVLMKRQRLLTLQTTPFFLAQRCLPSELLQDIRMAPLEDAASKNRRLKGILADEDH